MNKNIEEKNGRYQGIGIGTGWASWGEGLQEESVEELAVIGNDIWELSAAVMHLKESSRPVKILTVSANNVRKTAQLFQCLGVQGVVRDPMGLVVISVSDSPET